MASNDFPALDFDLGETADMLRDTVRSFADDQIAPLADRIDRDNEFPRQLWPKLGSLGLLGVTVSEEHGGAGMGYLEHCVAMEEISRASASVGLSYGAHSNLCVNQISLNGPARSDLRRGPGGPGHVRNRCRLGCGLDAPSSGKKWRPLHSQRYQDVDH